MGKCVLNLVLTLVDLAVVHSAFAVLNAEGLLLSVLKYNMISLMF